MPNLDLPRKGVYMFFRISLVAPYALLGNALLASCLAVAAEYDDWPDDDRPKVAVLFSPVQQYMLGPNPSLFDGRDSSTAWDVVPGAAGDAYLGLGPALRGVGSLAHFRGETGRLHESVKDVAADFKFHEAVIGILDDLRFGVSWRMIGPDVSKRASVNKNIARKVIRNSGADLLMFLDFKYFITPGLDQIRLRVTIIVYDWRDRNAGAKEYFHRSVEFLSQSRGDLFRPWREGEKETLVATIESEYRSNVERYPKNKKSYKKYRDKALDVLEGRAHILPDMALREGWPAHSFSWALREASDRMSDLLAYDLEELSPFEEDDTDPTVFEGFDTTGRPKKLKGYLAKIDGDYSVYRDKDGNVYMLPSSN